MCWLAMPAPMSALSQEFEGSSVPGVCPSSLLKCTSDKGPYVVSNGVWDIPKGSSGVLAGLTLWVSFLSEVPRLQPFLTRTLLVSASFSLVGLDHEE